MPVRVRLWAQIRKVLRPFFWAIGSLLALWVAILIVVYLLLQSDSGQKAMRRWSVALLQEVLGTDVEMGRLRLSGIAHISLEKLVIYDKACQPFLQVEKAQLGWIPFAFWRGFWRGQLYIPVSSVLLEDPNVYIYVERGSGLSNLDRLFPSDTSDTEGGKWRMSLGSLQIRRGSFRWIDSTQADSALLPMQGFLRYAHLYIDSLYIEAAVEWSQGGKLFAHLQHLTAHERNSGVRIPALSLLLEAYPDRVRISALEVRLSASHLRGKAFFPKEGLDKLFLDTDTKQFRADLEGVLDWREVSAFAGEVLPIQGRWGVAVRVYGDLYRLEVPSLEVRLESGAYVRGEGEIVHYARPTQMAWNVRIREGSLSLSDIRRVIPVFEIPQELDTQRVWGFRAEHTGDLRRYQTKLETQGVWVDVSLKKDSTWVYGVDIRFDRWDSQWLIPISPLREVSGTLTASGRGLGFTDGRGIVRAHLQGWYEGQGEWSLIGEGVLEQEGYQGILYVESPYGVGEYRGTLPLSDGGAYFGEGSFTGLKAQLWGGVGTLSGYFQGKGRGIPWREGTATLRIDSLVWYHPEAVHRLGTLRLEAVGGQRYEVLGEGLAIWVQGEKNWLQGLKEWEESWTMWTEQGVWPSDQVREDWELTVRMAVGSSIWLSLTGVEGAPQFHGTVLEAFLKETGQGKEGGISLEWDSLSLGSLQIGGTLVRCRVEEDSLPRWQAEVISLEGKTYVPYQGIHVKMAGSLQVGEIEVGARIGAKEDSLQMKAIWKWPSGKIPVQLFLRERNSFFSLAGKEWTVTFPGPITFGWDGRWEVGGLRAESGDSYLYFLRNEQRLLVEVERLPLEGLLSVLGRSLPVGGVLHGRWEMTQGAPTFRLLGDSLRYERQVYPQIWAMGEAEEDSVLFRFGLREGKTEFLTGTGCYHLRDTLSPLRADIRSVRIPASWLEPFLGDYIRNPRGYFRSQRLIVTGSPLSPAIYGEIFCDGVGFYMPFTRLSYLLEGVVRLRSDTLYVPDIELREPRGKRAFLSGFVALRGWSTPFLSLRIQLRDAPFLLASAPSSADAYLYGRAELDQGSLSITGPWNTPTLRGELRLAESTDLTLPLQTYERGTSAPHVRFIQSASSRDSLPFLTAPEGVEVRIVIRSVQQARFRLLFDERTGDEVMAQGVANLLFSIDREGAIELSGSYEIQSGEYRVNLQGIASKRLNLEPGSIITWDGDLYAGEMNLTATYRAFTSLRMIDTSFTYTVPVELHVFLKGGLLSPTMSFQVDIPSFSGTPTPMVNLFLQRLATDEQERNRQVFALLVLGSFVPLDQGLGSQQVSSGVSSTLAEFLSAQLAGWVGQTLGSQIGVAFSLGQWNELSAQLRLSLGQRFTIERDGVVVGPGQTAASLGNLSARYRLLPSRLTQPTQWQLEMEGFSRQTFMWGMAGASSQGAGIRLRKGFYLPERRKKLLVPPSE
ncbi:MAG: translocation/assembly module TamB [Bacteroidia bacterium]|nr:translocation/assembly module TamB [Bacteroidia bacterium]